MATQARTMPVPRAQSDNGSSTGVIGQFINLLTQPATFFHRMPYNRQWVWAAVLVLVIVGFAAMSQAQPSTTSSTQTTQGFSLSLLQNDEAANGTTSTTDTQAASTDTDTEAKFMSALLAACGVLVMWAGQATLMGLIPMLRGYPPDIKRNLQIAVWASLPLALVLILRQIYFARGGTGGALGLSLLLEQWDAYSTLPDAIQRVLAVFVSNVTLFSLWSLALLYFGARYTLNGSRWSAIVVLALWIATATIVPAMFGEPVTTTAPTTATTATEQINTSTGAASSSAPQSGPTGMFSGGMPPDGGMPPSGGPPGG